MSKYAQIKPVFMRLKKERKKFLMDKKTPKNSGIFILAGTVPLSFPSINQLDKQV